MIGNFYLFTGRELDILDSGSLKIQYSRARYYDTETGRFLSRDPLGVVPASGRDNPFAPRKQFKDGMNLYEYVKSNSINGQDPKGLTETGLNECLGKCKSKFKEELDTANWIHDCAVAGCNKILSACNTKCSKMPDCTYLEKLAKKSCYFLCSTTHGVCISGAYAAYVSALGGASFNYGACVAACYALY